MCTRFFTSVCFCSSPGYSVTEGVKLKAHGGFYVQRAEETRLWRRFPLAVAVYRLTCRPLSTLTRFTVRPAHQDCSTQNYLLLRILFQRTTLGENVSALCKAVYVNDVLHSSCPHASQRLGSESLVCLFKTEHVKKRVIFIFLFKANTIILLYSTVHTDHAIALN